MNWRSGRRKIQRRDGDRYGSSRDDVSMSMILKDGQKSTFSSLLY